VSRGFTYFGLLAFGLGVLWLLARPFFGLSDDLALSGAVRAPQPVAIETHGWTRLRVSPQLALTSRADGLRLPDIAFAVCENFAQREALSRKVYRVDVAFDAMISRGEARPLPFSIPVAEGRCADPTDPVRTRVVYPGELDGWELRRGGVVDLPNEPAIRFVSFEWFSDEAKREILPFNLACDFLIEDRVARQFLHAIKASLPEKGSAVRFAIGFDRGIARPAFQVFEYGVQSCREVRA